MPTKVFVGHMQPGTTSQEMEELFIQYGSVAECVSLGIGNYGFVVRTVNITYILPLE